MWPSDDPFDLIVRDCASAYEKDLLNPRFHQNGASDSDPYEVHHLYIRENTFQKLLQESIEKTGKYPSELTVFLVAGERTSSLSFLPSLAEGKKRWFQEMLKNPDLDIMTIREGTALDMKRHKIGSAKDSDSCMIRIRCDPLKMNWLTSIDSYNLGFVKDAKHLKLFLMSVGHRTNDIFIAGKEFDPKSRQLGFSFHQLCRPLTSISEIFAFFLSKSIEGSLLGEVIAIRITPRGNRTGVVRLYFKETPRIAFVNRFLKNFESRNLGYVTDSAIVEDDVRIAMLKDKPIFAFHTTECSPSVRPMALHVTTLERLNSLIKSRLNNPKITEFKVTHFIYEDEPQENINWSFDSKYSYRAFMFYCEIFFFGATENYGIESIALDLTKKRPEVKIQFSYDALHSGKMETLMNKISQKVSESTAEFVDFVGTYPSTIFLEKLTNDFGEEEMFLVSAKPSQIESHAYATGQDGSLYFLSADLSAEVKSGNYRCIRDAFARDSSMELYLMDSGLLSLTGEVRYKLVRTKEVNSVDLSNCCLSVNQFIRIRPLLPKGSFTIDVCQCESGAPFVLPKFETTSFDDISISQYRTIKHWIKSCNFRRPDADSFDTLFRFEFVFLDNTETFLDQFVEYYLDHSEDFDSVVTMNTDKNVVPTLMIDLSCCHQLNRIEDVLASYGVQCVQSQIDGRFYVTYPTDFVVWENQRNRPYSSVADAIPKGPAKSGHHYSFERAINSDSLKPSEQILRKRMPIGQFKPVATALITAIVEKIEYELAFCFQRFEFTFSKKDLLLTISMCSALKEVAQLESLKEALEKLISDPEGIMKVHRQRVKEKVAREKRLTAQVPASVELKERPLIEAQPTVETEEVPLPAPVPEASSLDSLEPEEPASSVIEEPVATEETESNVQGSCESVELTPLDEFNMEALEILKALLIANIKTEQFPEVFLRQNSVDLGKVSTLEDYHSVVQQAISLIKAKPFVNFFLGGKEDSPSEQLFLIDLPLAAKDENSFVLLVKIYECLAYLLVSEEFSGTSPVVGIRASRDQYVIWFGVPLRMDNNGLAAETEAAIALLHRVWSTLMETICDSLD